MYEIKLNKFSQKEYDKLDGSQKILVKKGFRRIRERGMNAGGELGGQLKDCRKLKYRSAGLRIVFRQDGDNIEIIEVLAICNRSDEEVYKDATSRL